MNAELFREIVISNVIPALRVKMPWCSTITVQVDGARPHIGKDADGVGTIELLNIAGSKFTRGPKVRFKVQSPQSPDFNLLDLCIFSSWARRHHHLQKHALTGDLKQLWENIQEVFWNGLDTDMINRSWQNLVWILRRVVELKGGNHVTMKHLTAAERLALLPPM